MKRQANAPQNLMQRTTAAQVAALLRDGLRADREGSESRARDIYERVLHLDPENPDALQLLGLIAKRQGDAASAEELMRRSLRSHSEQPNVWNNLGNLLEAKPDLEQAQPCFERAIALKSDYADAHYNLARVLRVRGQAQAARESLDRAILLKPGIAPMLQLRAMLQSDEGEVAEALATLDQAIALAPQRAQLHHNRGVALHRAQRSVEALAAHERALALGGDEADLHYNHGNALQALGRAEEAMSAYRQALERAPLHALALYDLARLRWRLGDPDYAAELQHAEFAHPASAVAPSLRGQLLLRAQHYADAIQAYDSALHRAPDVAALHDGRAQGLMRQGELQLALRAHQRAVDLAPTDVNLRSHFCASLLVAGQPDAALVQAEQAVAMTSDDQLALAMLGLCWRALRDSRERWLNDDDCLVAVIDLEAPTGWPDMASFNAELAEELQALHKDSQAPIDQSLRSGTQTMGDILDQGHHLLGLLRPRIEAAIGRYVATLPDDAAHPMLRRRHQRWHIADSWSSRLREGGRHVNHVHPHGWLSSAYYVDLPRSTQDLAMRQGWLQFGQSDLELQSVDAARRMVQPRVGRLVLFPSYFWHGTTPFDEQAQRLTIAFDVKAG